MVDNDGNLTPQLLMDERCKYWQVHQIVTSNKVVSLSCLQGLSFKFLINISYLKVNKSREFKRVTRLYCFV